MARPSDTFSTTAPTRIWPSSVSTAAPMAKFEYGTCERPWALAAAEISSSSSTAHSFPSSRVDVHRRPGGAVGGLPRWDGSRDTRPGREVPMRFRTGSSLDASQVSDRRGMGAGPMAVGGVGGLGVIGLLIVIGIQLLGGGSGGGG